jgi:hypothetical protein
MVLYAVSPVRLSEPLELAVALLNVVIYDKSWPINGSNAVRIVGDLLPFPYCKEDGPPMPPCFMKLFYGHLLRK